MSRLVVVISLLLLASCAAPNYQQVQDSVANAAAAKVRQKFANYFLRQFGAGIDNVLNSLADDGGFFDNPLVKILLPPPLGLLVDVGQALHNDPQAALLDVLLNQAAEHTVPLAGPILKATIEDIIATGNAEKLFSGDKTAVTQYLREQTTASLKKSLKPAVAKTLADSGAGQIYTELVTMADIINGVGEDVGEVAAVLNGENVQGKDIIAKPVAPEKLEDYVTDKAIEGIFKQLEAKEAVIREQVKDQMAL